MMAVIQFYFVQCRVHLVLRGISEYTQIMFWCLMIMRELKDEQGQNRELVVRRQTSIKC